MFNYRLAREIYGRAPLLVDGPTFSTLFNLLNDLRGGVQMNEKEVKLNNISFFDIKADALIVDSTYQMQKQAPDSELVYIINLNGPITKSGGMSSYGMKDLAEQMRTFDSDSRVKGGVIVTDSGGGSASGMEVMVYAITQLKKPIVAMVERAGCACSAAYGIISATDYIFAECDTSEVGSIGTMLSFGGYPNKTIDGDGMKHVTIYATASTKKNEWFEEAINNDNYEIAIDELLDPFNDRFAAQVTSSRPNIKPTQLDGSVYDAIDVVGSLVDEIGDLQMAVAKVLELSNKPGVVSGTPGKVNNKLKDKKAMNAEQLRTDHPAVYAEVFGAGVAQENDRIGAWMAHAGTDLSAVMAGIESGKGISATAREKFLVKASAPAKLAALASDSAATVLTPEAEAEAKAALTADEAEVKNIYGKHGITLQDLK